MSRHDVRTSLYAGVLLGVLGVVAWATGEPVVFPSLGPTVFVLATRRRVPSPFRTVVGAHAVGVVAGLAAYAALGDGATLTGTVPPASPVGLALATSGVLSVVLTTGGMLALDARHAPACATTLIVSLGLLSTPRAGALIVGSVALLVAVHALLGSVVAPDGG